ncbi:MAG: malto-oligosyltrehalose trehalohydrolase [Actinomycetes bacterium]
MTVLRVWAPRASSVWLACGSRLSERREMAREPPTTDEGPPMSGWWRLDATDLRHGDTYAFCLDGDPTPLPDPRSAWQPDGVHGPSRVYDHSRHTWTDQDWHGRRWPGSVVYELHVGTFTPAGTLDAAVERLGHLADLGITHVELLPLAAFPGRWGWGYDGVDLFAVHEPYGGPDALKRFVQAAHGHGLAVLVDVVYNHVGPDGNYLPKFGPYLTEAATPWGRAVNLDGPGSDEVRRFLLEHATGWLEQYHLDGLRLDAVHALVDHRARPLLAELVDTVAALSTRVDRPLTLVAESDLNDPRLVTSPSAGGLGLDATWDDDIHHALHALLTGESAGYYADFARDPYAATAKVLGRAYYHDGTYSSFRQRHHGAGVDRHTTPGSRFVAFLSNHDQVGNRARGDRPSATLDLRRLAIGAALALTGPATPMIFMGEEWAAGTPWQFFSDHTDPELAHALTAGRRREFAATGWDPAAVPDPQDEATYRRSQLDWAEPEAEGHRELLAWYRRLILLRRHEPALSDPRLDRVRVSYDAPAAWLVVHRDDIRVVACLASAGRRVELDVPALEVVADFPARSTRCSGHQVLMAATSVALVRVAGSA